MLNKSVFKQCVRSNGKLWAVFTFIACVMLGFMMSSFDAAAFSSFSSVAEGTKFESLASNLGSFLGTLETYYSMVAVLLAMVYTIIASSNLIVGEVDSGSMAYTLSTPISRISVVFTKAVYMIGSLVAMFAVLTVFGIGGAELTQHCVSDSAITEDVKAAAEAMDRRPGYVRDHLYMIQDDEYALKSGADARDMDVESYSLYLDEAMLRDSYKAAAKELTEAREEYYEDYEEEDDEEIDDDFIEITWEELQADPAMMLDNRDALAAGAVPMGLSVTEYKAYIENRISGKTGETADATDTAAQVDDADLEKEYSERFNLALSAAAKELDIDVDELSDNLIWMKADNAMQAQMDATGLSEAVLTEMINQAMVAQALGEDDSVDFDIPAFIMLNFGCFLLILAFSAIGFFASCLFNRSNKAMVLGGGLPFVFYLFSIMQQLGENLENFKYFTITTLYDTSAIVAMEDYGIGLVILAAISVVLYTAGCTIFCKKDLPL